MTFTVVHWNGVSWSVAAGCPEWSEVGLTRKSRVGSRMAGLARSGRQFAGLGMATIADTPVSLLTSTTSPKLPFVHPVERQLANDCDCEQSRQAPYGRLLVKADVRPDDRPRSVVAIQALVSVCWKGRYISRSTEYGTEPSTVGPLQVNTLEKTHPARLGSFYPWKTATLI